MKLTPRFFLPGFVFPLALTMLMGLAGACLHGCASNPIAAAQTVDQKAYAVYGAFVICEEQGAQIVSDASVDVHVRQAIQAADAKAKPSADALLKAYTDYTAAQRQLASGRGTAESLAIATASLNQWILTAQTDVNALVAAVKSH